jgi:Icc-related predicted phosphoesterase
MKIATCTCILQKKFVDCKVDNMEVPWAVPIASDSGSSIRVVVFSDSHNNHNDVEIPDGDVLIFCGDATEYGSDEEILEFDHFLGKLPHRHKLVTLGNHERAAIMRNTPQQIQEKYFKNATYVQDEQIIINGIKIYLSPWANNMSKLADVMIKATRGVFYAKNDLEMRAAWNNIPDDVNILVTHCPPYGILDDEMGCKELLARIPSLPHLKVHLFGHVHSGHGVYQHDGVTFVNATVPKTSKSIWFDYKL